MTQTRMNKTSKTLITTLCAGSLLALAGFRSPQTAPPPQAPVKGAQPVTVTPVQVDPSAQQLPPVKTPPLPGQAVPMQQPVDPASLIVRIDPSEVDFGEIPTGDSGARMVKLINTGDKPMTIVTHRVTCGCTALDLAPNYVIGPKEVKEVRVQLNGGATAGPLHGKKVTFVVDGQPEIELNLKAMAVSFVTQVPESITPESAPDGKVTLKSRDGTAFRILSMQPPVVKEFPKEPAAEHVVTIDWDEYRKLGISRKTVFYFDHPKCGNMMANIAFSAEELAADQRRMMEQKAAGIKPGSAGNPDQIIPNDTFVNPAPMDPNAVLANMIQQGQNAEVIKKIAEGLDPNTRDQQGLSLLSVAAKFGNVDMMNALINAKASIDSTDNAGRTPLMHAATSKNVEAVRAMLDKQASVTTRDALGGTALSWAAGFGDAASVKELLDAGAEADIVGRITGWTPLIWASGFGDPASIPLLTAMGANVEIADFLEGATPMIHAARTGKVETLQALIKAGAKLETPDLNGLTPLLSAAKNSGGDVEKVKFLLDAGANLKAKDNRGANALALARKRTDPRGADVVRMLEPLLGSETPADIAPAAASNTPAPSAPPASLAKPAETGHEGHDHATKPGSGQ